MISLNLLPDIKQAHLKVLRTKNMVIATSTMISFIAIGILVVLGIIIGSQVLIKNNLRDSINKSYSDLSGIDDFNHILTVQSQANNIDGLYTNTPVVSRLFDYMRQLNPSAPNSVLIDQLVLDYSSGAPELKITASTENSEAVAIYQDTLRKAKLQSIDPETKETTEQGLVFDSVATFSTTRSDTTNRVIFVLNTVINPLAFSREFAAMKICVPKTNDPNNCEPVSNEKIYNDNPEVKPVEKTENSEEGESSESTPTTDEASQNDNGENYNGGIPYEEDGE